MEALRTAWAAADAGGPEQAPSDRDPAGPDTPDGAGDQWVPPQASRIAQATNWTNWPKWSKWSNWANK